MTTPQIANPQNLLGQQIGVAQAATKALADLLFARAGTRFEEWILLRYLTQTGPAPRPDLADTLAGLLDIGPGQTRRIVDSAIARGLVASDGDTVRRTPQGEKFYATLVATVQDTATKLYGDLPPADLAVTSRTLTAVAQRASEYVATA
jgi:DNA-binding MarR family transcriptional regulator